MRTVELVRMSVRALGSHRTIYLWWLIWIVWLPFFISTIVDLVHTHPAPAQLVVSLAGVALFFTLYLWTTWRCAQRLASATPPIQPSPAALWTPIAAMLALGVGLTLWDGPAWGALFIYTSACAAGWLPLRQAVGTIAGMVAFTLVGLGLRIGLAAIITPVAFIVVPGIVVIALVRSVTTSQRLRVAREEMARLAGENEERLRIARDLHDLLGHNLSLIALKSELARRLVGVAPERAAVEIGDIERVARQALQEVREAVAGYRQPSLASELAGAREVLAAAGIAAHVADDDRASRDLPPAIDAALAWVVREGVTNVVRHSHARSCTIRVAQTAREVTVEVADDGTGPSATVLSGASTGETTSTGLRGVAERVAALGGRSEAGPGVDGGFRLCVRVPLLRDQSADRPPHAQPPASSRTGSPAPARIAGQAAAEETAGEQS